MPPRPPPLPGAHPDRARAASARAQAVVGHAEVGHLAAAGCEEDHAARLRQRGGHQGVALTQVDRRQAAAAGAGGGGMGFGGG